MRHQSPINVTEPRACRWYMSEPERYMANAKPPTPCNTTLDWYAAILLVLCSMTCSGCCCCWWRRHQDITKSVLPVRLTWVVTVYENFIENIMASSPFGNHLVKTITPSQPPQVIGHFPDKPELVYFFRLLWTSNFLDKCQYFDTVGWATRKALQPQKSVQSIG